MNFNAPLLDWLFRVLRFDQQSMIRYPPGEPDRVLVVWAVMLAEVYLLLWLVWLGVRTVWPRKKVEAAEDPPPEKKRWWTVLYGPLRALGLALLILASYLGVLEWAVRSYVATQPTPNFIPHPLYQWRFGPNLRNFPLPTPVGTMYFDTNGEGLRARDVPAEKAPNEIRIIVLGDSASFGQSIAFDKMYSQMLETLLQQKYPDKQIRVINGGTPGYSILQGYFLMEQVCMAYKPDLVVVNEFNEFSNRQVGEFDTVVPRSRLEQTVKEWLWRSMAYMTMRKIVARFTRPLGPPKPEMSGPKQQLQPDDETIEYMARFVELFKKTDTRAVFVMWRRPQYWSSTFEKLLAGQSPDHMIAVDYNPFLLGQHGDVFWLKDDPSMHPSEEGHRLMAEALVDTIVSNKMLEKK